MNYKITSAHEYTSAETGLTTLHVKLEIDGIPTFIGGLPAGMKKDEVIVYIETHYEKLSRQAVENQDSDKPSTKTREDLFEPPKDLAKELDDLKAKVAVLESKQVVPK